MKKLYSVEYIDKVGNWDIQRYSTGERVESSNLESMLKWFTDAVGTSWVRVVCRTSTRPWPFLKEKVEYSEIIRRNPERIVSRQKGFIR